jgi:ClpP class serine protease
MWLAASAEEIYAHPGASAIGSIGVYSAYLDSSLAFANEGLKWEIFSAGKYKTEGMQGTSLSDDFKELVQKDVDAIYDKFTAHMVANRTGIAQETMEGLTYDAPEALENKLIDGIVKDPSEIFIK